jgi:predicted transposase YbfD/YdcC
LLVHPVIAESCASAIGGLVSDPDPGPERGVGLAEAAVAGPDLLKRFAGISDRRSDQGREHPVAVVLTLCAAAVLAGMRSFTAIAGWITDVPAGMVACLYVAAGANVGAARAAGPSKTTVWRVLTGADAAAVDAAIGAWLAQRAHHSADTGADMRTGADTGGDTGAGGDTDSAVVAIAVDGKTVRGAVDTDGNQPHLLAAATHDDQLVLAQVEVGAKTNEIPMFAPLLAQLAATGVDLGRVVITADALHCQRTHAQWLHERGAGFVFTTKLNQPTLYAALDALPWPTVPIGHREVERARGRVTTRTIQVLPAPSGLPFPHVRQVWLIERYVRDPAGTLLSGITALGVTNLAPNQAGPADLARLVRRHWGIESLHWLRDTVYREDDSRAATRSGPRVMAALRNLSIGALHLAGRRDITEATRWAGRVIHRPFQLLGLTTN